MNYNIDILIEENRRKLAQLIENKADYEEILAQSMILDDYIVEYIKKINR